MEEEIIEILMEVIDEHKDVFKKGTEMLIKEVVKNLIKRASKAFWNQKKPKKKMNT